MSPSKPTPERPTGPSAAEDDVVIDLTDSATAAHADDRVSATELVIDLTDEAIASRRITPGAHVTGRPPDLLEHHRLELITGGDRWMDCEAFVYERYRSIGYTHESSRKQVEELARWADNSRFHAVISDDEKIVGTVRTILGNYADLPVGQFERIDFSDPDPVCELSSLVVDQSVRSSGVLDHLFRAGWSDAIRLGASAIVALVDTWLLEVFRASYALPFVPVGIPHFHMGGDVVPVTMDVGPAGAAEVGRNNPHLWVWSLEVMTPEEIDRYGLGGHIDPAIVAQLPVGTYV